MEDRGAGYAGAGDYALVLYALLALGLPFLADSGVSGVVFVVLWLGGSCLTGIFVARKRIFLVTGGAFVLLMIVLLSGLADTEFFSDPLSSIALVVLAGGEVLAALAGAGLTGRIKGTRSRDRASSSRES